jgi:hypothetical protein
MSKKILSPALLLASTMSIFAQGSLTPPGAPAATMKTLDQIEPRTPISASFTISTSGSYYLTKNITVGASTAIAINASNVTLDLNGFTISSTQNPIVSGTGGIILSSGLSNIVIMNGTISSGVTFSGGVYSGTGFDHGIFFGGTGPKSARVYGVNVSGVKNNAIYLGFDNGATMNGSTSVENCIVNTAGGYGIYAGVVSNSMALTTANSAITALSAQNCSGISTSGDGIAARNALNCYGETGTSNPAFDGIDASMAENCYGVATAAGGTAVSTLNALNCRGFVSSGNGNAVEVGNSAMNCSGSAAGGDGISAGGSAVGCHGSSNSGRGIAATVVQNCRGTSTSGIGIDASSLVENSYGQSSSSTGISAGLAFFCTGFGAPAISAGHQYFCGSGAAIYP